MGPEFIDIRERNVNFFVRLVDLLFLSIIFSEPFAVVFINRDTGEGAFVTKLLLLFGVVSLPLYKRYYRKWNAALISYVAFTFVGIFSDFANLSLSYMMPILLNARQMTVGCFIAVVAYNLVLRDSRYIRVFIYAIVSFAVLSSLFLVLNLSIRESAERGADGIRYSVLGQNANATSRGVGAGLIFSFLALTSGFKVNKLTKLLLLIITPIMLLALMKASSRGGVIFLMAALPICMFTARSDAKKLGYVILVTLALMAIVFAIMNSEMLRSRLLNTYYEKDFGARDNIYKGCIGIFKQSVLIGHGLMNHRTVLGHFLYKSEPIATHNAYTYPLVAGGLVGFALYSVFVVSTVKKALKIRYFQLGNYMFVASIFALMTGLSGNIEYAKWCFILFGTLYGAYERVPNFTMRIRP